MSIRRYLIICFMALFLAPYAEAGEVTHGSLNPVHVTVLGMTPGVDTLADARKVFGPAEAYSKGVGEHASTMLCYVSSAPGDETRVVFTAGGTGGLIRSIRILSGQVRFAEAGICAASARVSSDLATSGGLRLGLSPAGIRKLLGEPSEESPSRMEYRYYYYRKSMSEEEIRAKEKLFPHIRKYPSYYETSRVEARFHRGKAVRLDLSRMETSYKK